MRDRIAPESISRSTDNDVIVINKFEDEDIAEERIVFLEWTLRKLKAEAECQKTINFNDVDLHEELDDEIEYYTDLIKKWVQEIQLSN